MIDLATILALILRAMAEQAPAEARQSRPTAPVAQASDADRPPVSASEIKALRDSNIFAPRNRKYTSPKSTKSERYKTEPSAAPRPKPPVVTGIFFDAKLKAYVVVVEDRNEGSLKQFKDPKFLKSGDEVAGFKIGDVTTEKAGFIKGDVTKELAVGDSLPSTDAKSSAPATDDPEAAPTEGEEKVEIKPLDAEEKNKVLEKMKKERGKKNRPSSEDQ